MVYYAGDTETERVSQSALGGYCLGTIITTDGGIFLDETKKEQIRQIFDINVDSELFDPRLDYVAKRILTAESHESKQALTGFLYN